MEDIKDTLAAAAQAARSQAYAPYSHFTVGAALLAADGRIFCGCNMENAAYSPSLCAERSAFAQAIAAGCRDFAAIAICGGPEDADLSELPYAWPCGVCRQVMAEFCPAEFAVYILGGGGLRQTTLGQLLPERFGPHTL